MLNNMDEYECTPDDVNNNANSDANSNTNSNLKCRPFSCTEKYTCYLGLGSNLGDRLGLLQRAIEMLCNAEKIHVSKVSSMYETPPWGRLNQPAFINCVAEIDTELSPWQLLAACQQIEKELGRVRREHWGARTIDVDILYISGVAMQSRELTVPHPYMLERAFVLVPLAEIASELRLANGLTAQESLLLLKDRDREGIAALK